MTASLPSPDVYLSERIILCETKLQSDLDASLNSGVAPATVCDVVQLAARKAVGCAVGDGAVEGELVLGAQDTATPTMHGLRAWYNTLLVVPMQPSPLWCCRQTAST